ncbi:MAG TPA: hypothetical protein VMU51_05205, partial [Mycobacteriales bacterium]|nr:hypothetical protein [Mycobacteriales bacterium]
MDVPPLLPPDMSIFYTIAVGQQWPKASETQLRALGNEWMRAQGGLRQAGATLGTARRGVAAVDVSPSAEAADQRAATHVQGMVDLDQRSATMAAALINNANQTEYTKLQIDGMLALLYTQVAYALAWAPYTGGMSISEAFLAARMAQGWVRTAVARLIDAVSFFVLPEAFAQTVQVANGHRDGFDAPALLRAGEHGVLLAGAGLGVSQLLGRGPGAALMQRVFGRGSKLAAGVLDGAIAFPASNAAMYYADVTGRTEHEMHGPFDGWWKAALAGGTYGAAFYGLGHVRKPTEFSLVTKDGNVLRGYRLPGGQLSLLDANGKPLGRARLGTDGSLLGRDNVVVAPPIEQYTRTIRAGADRGDTDTHVLESGQFRQLMATKPIGLGPNAGGTAVYQAIDGQLRRVATRTADGRLVAYTEPPRRPPGPQPGPGPEPGPGPGGAGPRPAGGPGGSTSPAGSARPEPSAPPRGESSTPPRGEPSGPARGEPGAAPRGEHGAAVLGEPARTVPARGAPAGEPGQSGPGQSGPVGEPGRTGPGRTEVGPVGGGRAESAGSGPASGPARTEAAGGAAAPHATDAVRPADASRRDTGHTAHEPPPAAAGAHDSGDRRGPSQSPDGRPASTAAGSADAGHRDTGRTTAHESSPAAAGPHDSGNSHGPDGRHESSDIRRASHGPDGRHESGDTPPPSRGAEGRHESGAVGRADVGHGAADRTAPGTPPPDAARHRSGLSDPAAVADSGPAPAGAVVAGDGGRDGVGGHRAGGGRPAEAGRSGATDRAAGEIRAEQERPVGGGDDQPGSGRAEPSGQSRSDAAGDPQPAAGSGGRSGGAGSGHRPPSDGRSEPAPDGWDRAGGEPAYRHPGDKQIYDRRLAALDAVPELLEAIQSGRDILTESRDLALAARENLEWASAPNLDEHSRQNLLARTLNDLFRLDRGLQYEALAEDHLLRQQDADALAVLLSQEPRPAAHTAARLDDLIRAVEGELPAAPLTKAGQAADRLLEFYSERQVELDLHGLLNPDGTAAGRSGEPLRVRPSEPLLDDLYALSTETADVAAAYIADLAKPTDRLQDWSERTQDWLEATANNHNLLISRAHWAERVLAEAGRQRPLLTEFTDQLRRLTDPGTSPDLRRGIAAAAESWLVVPHSPVPEPPPGWRGWPTEPPEPGAGGQPAGPGDGGGAGTGGAGKPGAGDDGGRGHGGGAGSGGAGGPFGAGRLPGPRSGDRGATAGGPGSEGTA